MTFTLVAYCEKTGQVGLGGSTYSPAIGRGMSIGVPGKGVVIVQAAPAADVLVRGGKLLEIGRDAGWILNALASSDPDVERRQLAVVDCRGGVAVRTGTSNPAWAGHVTGKGYVAAGNVLVGAKVVEAMAQAFEASASEVLAERLMRAVEAGRDAGGQPEGQTSSMLRVYGKAPMPVVDLRIDAAVEPVGELRRLYDWYRPLDDYYRAEQRQPSGKRWWQHMNEVGHGNWSDWLARKEREAQRAG
jgi:uncharacterized Ntn-hydrolase superfamily protein